MTIQLALLMPRGPICPFDNRCSQMESNLDTATIKPPEQTAPALALGTPVPQDGGSQGQFLRRGYNPKPFLSSLHEDLKDLAYGVPGPLQSPLTLGRCPSPPLLSTLGLTTALCKLGEASFMQAA